MKNILIISLIILCGQVSAQEMNSVPGVIGVEVIYTNGSELTAIGNRSLFAHPIMGETKKMANLVPHESIYIDYDARKIYKILTFNDGERFTNVTRFKYSKKYKIVGEEFFGGWNCTIAEISTLGNTYKVWYTNDIGYSAMPMPEIGMLNGVVFKITCNDAIVLEAYTSSQLTYDKGIKPEAWGKYITTREYNFRKNK